MRNPETDFMSPLRSQPVKKQRGGRTPGISSSSTSASGTASGTASGPSSKIPGLRGGSAGRPPVVGGMAPPMAQGPPPHQPTPSLLGLSAADSAEDGIARRRAELRRLQSQKKARSRRPGVDSTTTADRSASAPPKRDNEPSLRHTSDLFPSVPKSSSSTAASMAASASAAATNLPTTTASTATSAATAATSTSRPPKAPPSGNAGVPLPPVNRKLEFPASRAKSAPPSSLPPPPPKKDEPEGLSVGPSRKPPPPRLAPVSLSRDRSGRVSSIRVKVYPRAEEETINFVSAGEEDDNNNNNNNNDEDEDGIPIPPAESPLFSPGPTTTPNEVVSPPSTDRRNRLRKMREAVPVGGTASVVVPAIPQVPVQSEANARLEAALAEAHAAKLQALQQVTQLEEKLAAAHQKASEDALVRAAAVARVPPLSQQQQSAPPGALQKVLELAEGEGEAAALAWARSQLEGLPPNLRQFQPVPPASPGTRRTTGSGNLLLDSNSSSLPIPMVDGIPPDRETAKATEKQCLARFREAVSCVPFEYASSSTSGTTTTTSAGAIHLIRRPYNLETTQGAAFAEVSPTTHEAYSKKAHVSTVSTLEVAIHVQGADDRKLLVYGEAGVRWQRLPEDGPLALGEERESPIPFEQPTWETVADWRVEGPLGKVTYIDNEGTERDYSLDALVGEALAVREQYARVVTSTALGLLRRPMPEAPKPPSTEVAVDTADIPETKKEAKEDKSLQKTKQAPPQEEEQASSGSGDILAVFVGMLFQKVFGTIWWILFGLPLAIIRTVLVGGLALAIGNLLYLYLRADHFDQEGISMTLGAGSAYYQNAPGIL